MIVIMVITAGSLQFFEGWINNLKMIKMESFIAFTITSLQNKRNLCFPSYRKHTDLIPLINDNGSKNT